MLFVLNCITLRSKELTNEFPLSVWNESAGVALLCLQLQIDTAAVVRPRPELHRALLVVERKPRDVDFTGAQEETRRHPQTVAC